VDFQVALQTPDWYALIVEDQRGRKAYSNPIWTSNATGPSTAREMTRP
jgi:hypothetical protein